MDKNTLHWRWRDEGWWKLIDELERVLGQKRKVNKEARAKKKENQRSANGLRPVGTG